MWTFRHAAVALVAVWLSGCSSTTMQGYADRQPPARPIQHIAAYVAAPLTLATDMQASIAEQGRKRGVVAEDALAILPPTRQYTDAEVRSALAQRGVDGVLLITVADSGVISQYAGTIFQSSFSGVASTNGTLQGTTVGAAAPTFRYSRQTHFSARLLEASSGRTLWVGNGEVDSGGGKGLLSRIAVSNSVSSSNAIGAIFTDLQSKGLIRTNSS